MGPADSEPSRGTPCLTPGCRLRERADILGFWFFQKDAKGTGVKSSESFVSVQCIFGECAFGLSPLASPSRCLPQHVGSAGVGKSSHPGLGREMLVWSGVLARHSGGRGPAARLGSSWPVPAGGDA